MAVYESVDMIAGLASMLFLLVWFIFYLPLTMFKRTESNLYLKAYGKTLYVLPDRNETMYRLIPVTRDEQITKLGNWLFSKFSGNWGKTRATFTTFLLPQCTTFIAEIKSNDDIRKF